MKKLLLILLCLPMIGFGQDIIVLKNNNEILCKVLKISKKNIEYRKFSNLEGPIYEQDKSDIIMIRYENGEVEIFKERERKYRTNWKGWVLLGVISNLVVVFIIQANS